MPAIELAQIPEEELPIVEEILQQFPLLSGIIVAWLDPTGRCEGYWHRDLGSVHFGDDTQAEDPTTFKSVKTAQRRADLQNRDDHLKRRFVVAFWVHPESHYRALGKYQRMLDGRWFPGSPRQ